ncbi:hypothetical protein TNIN_136301 [Trichonephila inaurata madagascariensis]|uniref:Uncharacterized protein n=1 Tax=Trichonephila inaurata madagascariensis TaxID=2747483 RepID=A0A8X6M7A4_9ARAC|nr:hypothetical protein TNIN_136301 [Trichonephila inaurata madagascariensis]
MFAFQHFSSPFGANLHTPQASDAVEDIAGHSGFCTRRLRDTEGYVRFQHFKQPFGAVHTKASEDAVEDVRGTTRHTLHPFGTQKGCKSCQRKRPLRVGSNWRILKSLLFRGLCEDDQRLVLRLSISQNNVFNLTTDIREMLDGASAQQIRPSDPHRTPY